MSTSAPNPVADPTLDFLPLFPDQTEDAILERMIGWANEGLDPVADAATWVDTREGGHWRTVLMPAVRELARLYDAMGTEVPMSGFVLWAWEVYLDDLAAVWDVERKPATPALGTVTFSGPVGTDIAPGTRLGVAPSTPDDPAPTFDVQPDVTIPVGGSIDATIAATEPGSAGDVAALAITVPITPLPAGVTFVNSEPTTGGTDVESDDSLRARLLEAIKGKGPGTVKDYIRWAGAWPGVGRVSVVPVWNGASTVLVMISDPNGQPLASAIVDALQHDLDPNPGTGSGTAPVGAHVTVDTSVLLNVTVDATITFLPGYNWDGSGALVAVGPTVQAAIVRYLLTVNPGGTVRLAHIAGIIATAVGVDNVTNVLINGVAADLAVGLTPPQVPVLQTFTAH